MPKTRKIRALHGKERSMKKSRFLGVLAALLALSVSAGCFTACGGSATPSVEPSEEPSVEQSTPAGSGSCTYLPEGEGYVLVDYIGTATEITIPKTYLDFPVLGVACGAFQNNQTLQKITLPASVTSIEEDAFRGCTALQTVSGATGVTKIGANAFDGCVSLQRITGMENCLAVWTKAFYGCASLQEINLSSAYYIGMSAFEGCTALTKVVAHYEEGKDEIEYESLSGCIVQEVELPAAPIDIGRYTIGKNAFKGCTSLTTALFRKNYFSMIEEGAFSGCTALTDVTIARDVKSIGKNAFDGCTALQRAYYHGDSTRFARIVIDPAANLFSEVVFYNTASAPHAYGNYWYYNYNFYGEPTPWF